MTKPHKFFFCAIFLSSFLLVNGIGLETAFAAADILQTILNVAELLTGNVISRKLAKYTTGENMELPTQNEIYEQFDLVNVKIDNLSQKIDQIEFKIQNIQKMMRSEIYFHDIFLGRTRINDLYNTMNDMILHREFFNKSIIIEYAKDFIGTGVNSPAFYINLIYRILLSDNENLFNPQLLQNLVLNLQSSQTELCELNQSPKNVLLSLYNVIILNQLKGFALIQFGYAILNEPIGTKKKTKYNYLISQTNQRHKLHLKDLTRVFQNAMDQVSNEYFKCDPPMHIRGKTYEEISPIVQGFVIDQDKLDSSGRCFDSCSSYQFQKIPGCKQNDVQCKMQKKCNKIIKCESLGGDATATACLPNKSFRRYEYVEGSYGVLGKKDLCPSRQLHFKEYAYGLFWKCIPCMCFCEESTNKLSERYISLRRSRSDIKNNKIVVGVRFIKLNKILHLQVQEADLLPYGEINATTIQWVNVDAFNITSRRVYEGQDYHTFKYNQATFDLDSLKAPSGSLVTGVRFKRVGSHLNFEVHTTPFNYTSGELQPQKSVYIDNLPSTRTQLELVKPDVPTHCSYSEIDSLTNQYITLTHSDLQKDAAQTTVPFFDVQPVVPRAPSILQGVGIYHKGQPHCGGFLGLKIFTYDHSQHINLSKFL